MVNNFKSGNTQTILALALSTALLSACGGGSSDGGSTTTTTTVSGRAVDGPLAGSTVTFVDCGNQTVITNADGKFTFPTGCTSSSLTVTGGLDTTTEIPFTGTLKAPSVSATASASQIAVTPITTLIANAGSNNATAIATALGLTGVDLLRTDPLTSPALLAKNVAVQQLVEQISQAVASLGGVSEADAAVAATKLLATTLAAGTTTSLSSTSTVSTLVTNTVISVKDQLPAAIQANINNVSKNLAAISAATIATTVASTETTISALTAGQISTTAGLKTAAQTAIVEAKTDVTTQNLIDIFAVALTTDSTKIAEALGTVSAQMANDTPSSSTISTALGTISTNTGITISPTTVTAASSFNPNHILLGSVSVGNTSYTIADLNASLTTPKVTTSLDNLLINLKSAGTVSNTTVSTAATLKVVSSTRSILIHLSELKLSFSSTGALTAAVIPSGATYTVASTGAANLNTAPSTITTNVDAFNNGSLSLNSTVLGAINSDLKTAFSQFNSEKGTSLFTATLTPTNGQVLAVGTSNLSFASPYTLALKDKSFSGYGVSGKFTIQ